MQNAPGRGGTWPPTGEGDRKKKAQTRTASDDSAESFASQRPTSMDNAEQH